MTIDPTKWESRMDTMTLKRLYCLCELTRLTQSIGNEEQRSPHTFPNANPKSWNAVNDSRSPKREQMEKRVWNYIERKSRSIHGEDPDYPWIYAKRRWFHVVCGPLGPLAKDAQNLCVWERIKGAAFSNAV